MTTPSWSIPAEEAPEPSQLLVRWSLLVPVLVLAAWWPLDTYWQSDDFFALAYASDLGRAASDFVGPQYGAADLILFYRPLITLSFWFDQFIGDGPNPFVSHLSNALAHALSAFLLVRIGMRFGNPWSALVAGVLWGFLPAHAGSVLWAVGRVDSHTVVWILLAVLCTCRSMEGHRAARWIAVAACAAALGSKELAVVVPGLIGWTALMLAPREGRWRRAAREAAPAAVLVALYMALRWGVLGVLVGGYQGAGASAGETLTGFATNTLHVLNPWRVGGSELSSTTLGFELTGQSILLGFVPFVLALGFAGYQRRWGALLALAIAFAMALVPIAPLLHITNNVQNLRYFTLASAALALVFALTRPWLAAVAIVTIALPFVQIRSEYRDWHRELASIHGLLMREAQEAPNGPVFVHGLAESNERRNAVGFHLGADRLLRPPFDDVNRAVYPYRTLANLGGAFTLPDPLTDAPPEGSTWLVDSTSIGRGNVARVPDLTATLEDHGGTIADGAFSYDRLFALAGTQGDLEHPDAAWVSLPGRAQAYRITIFTGMGYATTLVDRRVHSSWLSSDETRTRINLFRLLGTARVGPPDTPAARIRVGDCLEVPCIVDHSNQFLMLIEAGRAVPVTPNRIEFTPRARTNQLLRITLPRRLTRILRPR